MVLKAFYHAFQERNSMLLLKSFNIETGGMHAFRIRSASKLSFCSVDSSSKQIAIVWYECEMLLQVVWILVFSSENFRCISSDEWRTNDLAYITIWVLARKYTMQWTASYILSGVVFVYWSICYNFFMKLFSHKYGFWSISIVVG